MTTIIALIAAGLILMLWRQILIVIAWVLIALIILGILSFLHVTDEAAPAAASSVTSQECIPRL